MALRRLHFAFQAIALIDHVIVEQELRAVADVERAARFSGDARRRRSALRCRSQQGALSKRLTTVYQLGFHNDLVSADGERIQATTVFHGEAQPHAWFVKDAPVMLNFVAAGTRDLPYAFPGNAVE